jgi:hypothetical protein
MTLSCVPTATHLPVVFPQAATGTVVVAWQTAAGAPLGAGMKPLLHVAVQLWPTSVAGQVKAALRAAG